VVIVGKLGKLAEYCIEAGTDIGGVGRMAALDDIQAILGESNVQLEQLGALHDVAFTDPSARRRLQLKVKVIVEQLRSILDYVAVDITNQYGAPKGNISYPLAQDDEGFRAEIDRRMPGVAASRPDIADVVRTHQPYNPRHDWLRQLNVLARAHKHNKLGIHLLRGTLRTTVTEDATGAFVEWWGIRFEPGVLDGGEGFGRIRYCQNAPSRDPNAPEFMKVGVPNLFGTPLIFGVPIDPVTQRPLPSAGLTVRQERMDRWYFYEPHIPVLDALSTFHAAVVDLVRAIDDVATLSCSAELRRELEDL
jgi:hypothetical protein